MVLEIQNLTKAFGKSSVLHGVSLHVDRGSVYGLVGLNGAGKTTLIRLILGLLKRDGGDISVLGGDPWRHDPRVYQRMGVVLESEGFNGNLSVRDNLRIFAAAKGISWAEALEYFNEQWSGTDIFSTEKKVKFLSRGQKVQCGLARAFLGWPELCVFDEPAVSLDLSAYEQMKRMVLEAKRRGAAVIISSHQLETIDALCDDVGLLRDGVIEGIGLGIQSEQNWMLLAEGECGIEAVIKSEGGEGVRFEEPWWRFSMSRGEDRVPEIVSKLVSGGCRVHEIFRERTGFSDSIRKKYRGSGSEEK